MNDKDFPSSIRSQFRQAVKDTCQPKAVTKVDAHAPNDLSASGNTAGNTKNGNTKSSTQVAPTVRPRVVRPEACGLKPGRKRPYRLMGRYSKEERDSVITRASNACMSVNEFIRLSTLEIDHIPPLNPELKKRFIAVYKELCRQGQDLDRIAEQMESNALSPNEKNSMLGMIGWSLVAAHRAVREAMTYGLEMPND
jgi:hypothetical protein